MQHFAALNPRLAQVIADRLERLAHVEAQLDRDQRLQSQAERAGVQLRGVALDRAGRLELRPRGTTTVRARRPRGRAVRRADNPLIDAGIGVTPGRRRLLETDPAIDFIGTWSFAPHLGSRAAWPAPDLGDALRTPVRSTIPLVLVSGDWDTSTPVENMLAIAPYFPNGHTIVVHHGEHDQLSYQMRADPAAFAAVLAFIATGATAKLPVEVRSPAPAFSVPAFPAPRP